MSESGKEVAEGPVDTGDRWCWQGVVEARKEKHWDLRELQGAKSSFDLVCSLSCLQQCSPTKLGSQLCDFPAT